MARKYNVFELYFKKNGEKKSILLNTVREVQARRKQLKSNKRKFLGVRSVSLIEA